MKQLESRTREKFRERAAAKVSRRSKRKEAESEIEKRRGRERESRCEKSYTSGVPREGERVWQLKLRAAQRAIMNFIGMREM